MSVNIPNPRIALLLGRRPFCFVVATTKHFHLKSVGRVTTLMEVKVTVCMNLYCFLGMRSLSFLVVRSCGDFFFFLPAGGVPCGWFW